jgi:hypothetical protein
MRVNKAVEEHLFCGAIVDNSPGSAVPAGANENLENHSQDKEIECGQFV